MHDGWIPEEHDLSTLVGKLIGRHEGTSISLEVLVALLEDKGILEPNEVERAVAGFLRTRGREYMVEQWGEPLGNGMYEGLTGPDGD
jgi:hypothetical protein